MLVVKIFVNEKQIDELHIQRVGDGETILGSNTFTYKIRKPKGLDCLPMYHRYSKGYRPLLQHALQTIERAEELDMLEKKEVPKLAD